MAGERRIAKKQFRGQKEESTATMATKDTVELKTKSCVPCIAAAIVCLSRRPVHQMIFDQKPVFLSKIGYSLLEGSCRTNLDDNRCLQRASKPIESRYPGQTDPYLPRRKWRVEIMACSLVPLKNRRSNLPRGRSPCNSATAAAADPSPWSI